MANRSIILVTGLAASSLLLGGAMAGCSSNKSSTPSSSSASSSKQATATSASASASAEPSDYSTLLIKATDIVVPNDTFSAQPATPNPGQPGVAGSFTNAAGSRVIGDTIMILPDASAASTALDGALNALGSNVTGAPQSASVGSNGVIASGPSPDGSKFVAVLLFTEGKAFTTIEFDSAADDPVPPEVVTDVGQKQDDAIKKGLPG